MGSLRNVRQSVLAVVILGRLFVIFVPIIHIFDVYEPALKLSVYYFILFSSSFAVEQSCGFHFTGKRGVLK
ncbi:Uncharacterized protein HZ326_21108 [Fusarium oxysporum f. sp. albedinis]|nr:Uncharacterized protein HZ326_21108 [Fusarium oxysporum f. sp. albedinis]